MNIIEETEEIISKSQIKRECIERQDLGEHLVKLPLTKLRKLITEPSLLDALIEAQKIHAYSAQKRMKKRIGKLLGNLDEQEFATIENFFSEQHQQTQQQNTHFHQLEQWRDRLLSGNDQVINELLEQYPHCDRGRLRQLVRNAQKEKQMQKPPKSARQIFSYLKEMVQ